ncbi:unnamed protein product [Amoebophrya sp. A25]|nr:unnamed protein product [Amoebophrya sp. A25]|eukprot:GSA25T00015176001.1
MATSLRYPVHLADFDYHGVGTHKAAVPKTDHLFRAGMSGGTVQAVVSTTGKKESRARHETRIEAVLDAGRIGDRLSIEIIETDWTQVCAVERKGKGKMKQAAANKNKMSIAALISSAVAEADESKVLLNRDNRRVVQFKYDKIRLVESFNEQKKRVAATSSGSSSTSATPASSSSNLTDIPFLPSIVIISVRSVGECLATPAQSEVRQELVKMEKPFVQADRGEFALQFLSADDARRFVVDLQRAKTQAKEEAAEKREERKALKEAGLGSRAVVPSTPADALLNHLAVAPNSYAEKSIKRWNLFGPFVRASEAHWKRYYEERDKDEEDRHVSVEGESEASQLQEKLRHQFENALVSTGKVRPHEAALAASGLFLGWAGTFEIDSLLCHRRSMCIHAANACPYKLSIDFVDLDNHESHRSSERPGQTNLLEKIATINKPSMAGFEISAPPDRMLEAPKASTKALAGRYLTAAGGVQILLGEEYTGSLSSRECDSALLRAVGANTDGRELIYGKGAQANRLIAPQTVPDAAAVEVLELASILPLEIVKEMKILKNTSTLSHQCPDKEEDDALLDLARPNRMEGAKLSQESDEPAMKKARINLDN